VVHTDAIIDTRAQKMISHTVAQFAHDHGEEQNTLSSPQLCCHSQEHKKWLVIQQCITESMFAHDQPTLWRVKHFSSTSYFLYAWFLHIAHTFFLFTTQK